MKNTKTWLIAENDDDPDSDGLKMKSQISFSIRVGNSAFFLGHIADAADHADWPGAGPPGFGADMRLMSHNADGEVTTRDKRTFL